MSKIFEYSVSTRSTTELVNVDHLIKKAIDESGVQNGICHVFVPHTTAAVTINENADPSVISDLLAQVNKVIPFEDNYRHLEGNSAAHIKSTLVGCSLSLLVEAGKPKLGTWQSVFFCEFDGPRNRRLWVKLI
ncbi:MAG: secondary thiamine-phosphate synthase enzyme YjbQ [bacterium]|nr:secondary thiamine-phosphate synthase enzyme YjbQ [bacterium]